MSTVLLVWIAIHMFEWISCQQIVQTEFGLIDGIITEYGRSFLGVPFAAPPINNLRWAYPQPPNSWNNTLQTKNLPPACPQICEKSNDLFCPSEISEDCLYLNIFTPISPNSNQKKLPVLLWFYGGSFNEGYSGLPLYNGTLLSNLTNTIIITTNYRVGALGFLWNSQLSLQGNYGYFDQLYATEWTYRNIENFGGDKDHIVIFGESAGAHSVALHILNQTSLIFGAIMESACIGLPLRTPNNWGNLPSAFSKQCGCSADIYKDPVQRLQCLRNVSFEDIVACQVISNRDTPQPGWYLLQYNQPWTPTVNNSVLPNNPLIAIQNGEWNTNIPIIIGSNKGEGWAFVDYSKQYTFSTLYDTLRQEFGESVAEKVLQFYNVTNSTGSTINETAQIITDFHFRCPARNVSRIKTDNIYNHHFDYVSSFNSLIYGKDSGCSHNACHSSEIPYVFDDDLSGFGIEFTEQEKKLSIDIIKYWTNFAKTGNPNNGESVNVYWNDFGETEQVLMIDIENKTIISTHFDDYNCNFWDSLGWSWFQGTN